MCNGNFWQNRCSAHLTYDRTCQVDIFPSLSRHTSIFSYSVKLITDNIVTVKKDTDSTRMNKTEQRWVIQTLGEGGGGQRGKKHTDLYFDVFSVTSARSSSGNITVSFPFSSHAMCHRGVIELLWWQGRSVSVSLQNLLVNANNRIISFWVRCEAISVI